MTIPETIRLVISIHKFYPLFMSDNMHLAIWTGALETADYKEVRRALYKYKRKNRATAPTPEQLLNCK